MWRRLRLALQFASVVLVLTACTEPQTDSTRTFEGLFALESIDGQPLPRLEPSQPGFSTMVVADTFAFDGRGHYRHRTVVEIQSQTDSVRDSQSSLGTGDYVVSADTVVEFPFSCPMGHFCVPALHGFVQHTGDLLIVYTMSSRHESRYKRVR